MKYCLFLLSLFMLSACSLQAVTPEVTDVSSLTPSHPSDIAAICEQKGYHWNADNTCSFVQESNETQPSITIRYPIELIQSAIAESTIDSYLNDYRANFMQVYQDNYQPEFGSWFSETSYDIYQHSPTIASVRFTTTEYTGGAHPNTWFHSFTFDTAANTVLAFEDLFAEGVDPLASIMPIAREKLLESMAEIGIDADTANSFIPLGTDELADYRNFALTDTDLLLFFDQNQVAPSAAGTQTISIPLSELQGMLRDL